VSDALTPFLAATIRTAVPLGLAALGELLVERAGLIAASANECHVGIVDEVARPVEPRHPHQHGGLVRNPSEALLAFAKSTLGSTVLGDVEHQRDDRACASIGTDLRDIFGLNRQRPTGRVRKVGGEPLPLARIGRVKQRLADRIDLVPQQLLRCQAEDVRARSLEEFGEGLVDGDVQFTGRIVGDVVERDFFGRGGRCGRSGPVMDGQCPDKEAGG